MQLKKGLSERLAHLMYLVCLGFGNLQKLIPKDYRHPMLHIGRHIMSKSSMPVSHCKKVQSFVLVEIWLQNKRILIHFGAGRAARTTGLCSVKSSEGKLFQCVLVYFSADSFVRRISYYLFEIFYVKFCRWCSHTHIERHFFA